MSKIVLATGNQGKVKELQSLLSNQGIEVVSQNALQVPSVEETGTTFIENAIIKARHASKITGLPAIADDSGLEVDALKGAPGIYSARYAGQQGNDLANMEKLLADMQNIPFAKRDARFHCVLVYMRHALDPCPIVCHGVWQGSITQAAYGDGGFGYDPIFWVLEHQCTAAQLAPEVKNAISHRAQALSSLLEQLKPSA